MNSCLRSTPFRILLVLTVASAAVAIGDVEVTPGQLNLEIELTSTAPEITAHLSSHNVQTAPWPEDQLPVRLYELGQPDPIVTATYEPSTTQPDPLATKALLPSVPPDGNTFLVEIDDLFLDGGSTYRVGSSKPAASASIMCGPVQPLTVDADGLDCTVSECAALVKLEISLVGDVEDLDALETLIPAGCFASASVEEFAWSGTYIKQATSAGAAFFVPSLRSGTGELPILVRGNGSRLKVAVGCTATVKQGETGFIMLPGTRQTPLSETIELVPGCDDVITVDVPILVERNAGVLKGLFDISGRAETSARVFFDYNGLDFSTHPTPVPATAMPDPSDPWIFEGAPATTPTTLLDVGAAALVDDGYRYLELPHRRGLNHGVAVAVGVETDLRSTFVSMPQSLVGLVVLDDRTAGIGLDLISTEPFSWLSRYQSSHSHISADGRPELLPGGKSGDHALSRSILQGGYDTVTGKAELSYELLLAGLSDVSGPLDGRGAAPTPWLVNDLHFYFDDPVNETWQRLQTEIGVLLARETEAFPPTGDPDPLDPIPELHMCLGEVSLTLRTDPTLAMLYSPRLSAYTDDPILTIPEDPYSLFILRSAHGTGLPVELDDRADEATVSIRLPAGAQYRVYPSIRIASPDGSTSNYMWFGGIDMPMVGDLQCGSNADPCVTVTDEGIASSLAIGIDPPVPACHETGDLVFDVVFDATEVVTSLTLEVDGQPPQTLCGPCAQIDGVTQPVPVTVNLPPDDDYHTVVVEATDALGCTAPYEMSVYVPTQPLTLVCAPDFTCTVPAADIPLGSDHCCIEDHLTPPQIVGGCNYPTGIIDNRPSTFPEGAIDVSFTAIPGEATCTTTVNVQHLPDYQLAYAEGDRIKVREVGSWLYQLDQPVPNAVAWLEFDASGDQLAAALAGSNPLLQVFDVNADSLRYQASSHPEGRNVEFRPGHPSDVAMILGSPTVTNFTPSYWAAIFRDGAQRAITRIPSSPFMSQPEIAWSRTGDRLLAIVAEPNINPAGNPIVGYGVRLIDWDVASTGLDIPTNELRSRDDNPREEPFQLLYAHLPGAGLFTSIRGISVMGPSGLSFVAEVPNEHMDLAMEPRLTAFVRRTATGVQISVITNPTATPAVIDDGPIFPTSGKVKPRVELSEDGARIAVALGDTIEILEYPGFAHIATLDAVNVLHMRFRPRDPVGDGCE